MSGPEFFGVVVRTIGLLLTLASAYQFFLGIHFREADGVSNSVRGWRTGIGVLGIIIGLLLLFGANFIVVLAYRL